MRLQQTRHRVSENELRRRFTLVAVVAAAFVAVVVLLTMSFFA
jgi:hypothetical protein